MLSYHQQSISILLKDKMVLYNNREKGIIKIKTLTLEDLGDIVRVEEEAWEPELRASRETFIERLKRFPEGFIGCYVNGKLAGITYGHPIKKIEKTWFHNSYEGAFNPKGEVFYIVNVGVSNYYVGAGVGSKLLDKNKELAKKLKSKKIVLGARNLESNLHFYKKNGFVVVGKIKNYFPEDKESNGIGVLMESVL